MAPTGPPPAIARPVFVRDVVWLGALAWCIVSMLDMPVCKTLILPLTLAINQFGAMFKENTQQVDTQGVTVAHHYTSVLHRN